MNDVAGIGTGMEELLQEFILEASDLLADVDSRLMDLEKNPDDKNILNMIFLMFHTIKGGVGFLFDIAPDLARVCCLTENIFIKLRNDELHFNSSQLEVILAATGEVHLMLDDLGRGVQPQRASQTALDALEAVLQGEYQYE